MAHIPQRMTCLLRVSFLRWVWQVEQGQGGWFFVSSPGTVTWLEFGEALTPQTDSPAAVTVSSPPRPGPRPAPHSPLSPSVPPVRPASPRLHLPLPPLLLFASRALHLPLFSLTLESSDGRKPSHLLSGARGTRCPHRTRTARDGSSCERVSETSARGLW